MIRTVTNPGGVIQDTSILKMAENSLFNQGGLLSRYHDLRVGFGDIEAMVMVLCRFWKAVSVVFAEAWGKPPKASRLMHGAGIVTMGYVMDAIGRKHPHAQMFTERQFADELYPLREICRWTDGKWEFGEGKERNWNEIQNTSKDITLLSNHVLDQFRRMQSQPELFTP